MNRYRFGISDSQLTAGLVAGFIATQVATITGFWYKIVGLPTTDWNRFNGQYLMPEGSDFEKFAFGWLFHLFTGLALSLAFVFLIHPMLPWPKSANNSLNNLGKAVVWGLVLALISALIIVPLVDPYNADPGFFSLSLELNGDGSGWQTPVSIFIWHIMYGVQLGSFYNPAPGVVTPALPFASASTPEEALSSVD